MKGYGEMTVSGAFDPSEFRVPKTAEVVASRLRRGIITGELTEGTALPTEQVLTAQFRISRPTLREAFRILESEGLIEIRRGARGGARVCPPSVELAARYSGLLLQFGRVTVADVAAAAAVIEAPAAAIVASDPPPETLQRLRDNLVLARQIIDCGEDPQGRMPALSREFHRALLEGAGNTTLALFGAMISNILYTTNRSYTESRASEGDRRRSHQIAYRAHSKLFALVESRDVTAADALWRKHVSEYEASIRVMDGSEALVLDLLS